jgi:hypothetical protein
MTPFNVDDVGPGGSVRPPAPVVLRQTAGKQLCRAQSDEILQSG